MHSNLWKNIINILKNYSAVFIFKRLRKWQNLPTDYSTIYMVIQLKYNICIYTRLLIIFLQPTSHEDAENPIDDDA